MKRFFVPLFLAAILPALPGGAAQEKPIVAFGVLANETEDASHGFIELIFPKSFASSIANRYDVRVLNPLQTEGVLKKAKMDLKKNYSFAELPELVEKLNAQVFINGSYAALKDNRIRISVNVFVRGSGEVFTFTNVGRMETDISILVDRVSVVIMNFFEEDSYRALTIGPGKRIGILTNLDNLELNRLYGVFMDRNYPVAAIQGNHLRQYLRSDTIAAFKSVRTGKTSYAAITDWRNIRLSQGAWSGPDEAGSIDFVKRVYRVFETGYQELKKDTLERLDMAFSGNMDYLMIIGFSDNRAKAWMRCVDVKSRDLVWLEDNYFAGTGDPVESLGAKIVDSLVRPMKNPFKAVAENGEKR